MARAVQLETDSAFFDMAELSIKTFAAHNHGWDLHVADIGMTDEQRERLREGATLYERSRDPGRWPNTRARIALTRQLLDQYDLVLHLDADTFTFGSIEPWLQQLDDADAEISGRSCNSAIVYILRHPSRVKEIFPGAAGSIDWVYREEFNTGVLLLKSTEKIRFVLADMEERYPKLGGMFAYVDQGWLSGATYAYDCKFLPADPRYNFAPHIANADYEDFVAPSDYPVRRNGTPVVIAHFAYHKPFFLRTYGGASLGYDMWRAWLTVLEQYRSGPWTT